MSYKLLKEHKDKYEMQHPDGKTFLIAKTGLNKKVIDHINSLGVKGYADGGLVDEPNASFMPEENADPTIGLSTEPAPIQPPTPLPMPASPAPMAGPVVPMPDMPPSNQARPVEQPQAQEVPAQQENPQGPSLLEGYNQINQGLGANAQAQSEAARKNADTYGQLQKDLKTAQDEHQKSKQAQVKELENLQEQASKDTDPNRYWNSMSTGNKISASIGLILGGIGAGMVKGENQALKVINNAIDNDIKSQMADKSNKMNIYKANLEKYKDDQEAFRQTKLELMTIADLKLKQAESSAKSQEAKAALQVARGELQMKAVPLIEEAAAKKTQRSLMMMAQNNPEAITPTLAQYLPEKDRERFVPGAGFALTAEGAKKIKEEYKPERDDAISAIDKLIALRKKYGSEIMSREAVAEANTLKGVLKGKLRPFLVGPGAVSESEQKIMDSIIQDPTSLTSGDASVFKSLETLKASVNNSYANKAKLAGLDMSRQAQEMGQAEVKTMNGIPYQKVNGGWTPLKTGK